MQFFIIQLWNELLRKICDLEPERCKFWISAFHEYMLWRWYFLKGTYIPVNSEPTRDAEFDMQNMSNK